MMGAACNSSKKMSNERSPEHNSASGNGFLFDTQGHRGCRGLMPENTIPAMLHALDLGVVTLEMDVVITKDKKVILSHEPFFNHEITTKPDGSYVTEKEERNLNIFRMDYTEVEKYDVGKKPHARFPQQQKIKASKPLLAAVFDSVKNYMLSANRAHPFFNIETKCLPISDNLYHPSPGEFIELLMQVIQEKGMSRQVLIQSFDFRSLQYLHQQYPSVATVMLIEESDTTSFEDQLKKLGFVANVYSPHYSMVTEALVKKCHKQNMRLIPWTVNDRSTIDHLKKWGVDGIISDYPNLFRN
jgi:glycerophosphoryl diester phosphodiesterase